MRPIFFIFIIGLITLGGLLWKLNTYIDYVGQNVELPQRAALSINTSPRLTQTQNEKLLSISEKRNPETQLAQNPTIIQPEPKRLRSPRDDKTPKRTNLESFFETEEERLSSARKKEPNRYELSF